MAHQAFGYCFILTCLYFSPYPLFAGDEILVCIALGLTAAGAAVQFFLLQTRKKARWFPLVCAGVLAVFEAQYQLTAFKVMDAMGGHDIWNYIFFGVVTLYILLGALLGWAACLAWSRFHPQGGTDR